MLFSGVVGTSLWVLCVGGVVCGAHASLHPGGPAPVAPTAAVVAVGTELRSATEADEMESATLLPAAALTTPFGGGNTGAAGRVP